MSSTYSTFRAPPPQAAPPPPAKPEVSPERLQKTLSGVKTGIWVCAAITMGASVVNGTSVFAALTEGAIIGTLVGLLTAVAVDAGLVVVLTGDSKMQELGISTAWGRAMRWIMLSMSLALNCGDSLLHHHWYLGALHAVPPLLLCGLSEYGEEVAQKFDREIRAQAEALAAFQRFETDRLANEQRAKEATAVAERRENAERVTREKEATAKTAEVALKKTELEVADRREVRDLQNLESARNLAGVFLIAQWLRINAMVNATVGTVTQKPSDQVVASPRRQALPPGSPGPIARSSPGGSPGRHQVDRQALPPGGRQVTPPPQRRTSPQIDPDVTRLVIMAKEIMEEAGDMGRIRLANLLATRLAEEAGEPGATEQYRPTDYMMKKVHKTAQDERAAERDAAIQAELDSIISGGIPGQ